MRSAPNLPIHQNASNKTHSGNSDGNSDSHSDHSYRPWDHSDRPWGFTLIELLVVIGTIAILAAVVLVAVNPGRQFASARDTQRRSDLYALTSAIVQYSTENNGNFPDQDNFPSVGTCVGDTLPCFDLAPYLVPIFVPRMPADPTSGTPANTQYFVFQDANRRLVATASGEITTTISITR